MGVGCEMQHEGVLGGVHSDSTSLQDMFGSVIIIIRNKYEENGLLTSLNGQEDLQHHLQCPGWLSERPFCRSNSE